MSENKDMRELSLDEMNKVSGGAEFPKSIDLMGIHIHDDESLGKFIDMVYSFEQTAGKEFAINMFNALSPEQPAVAETYRDKGLNGLLYGLRAALKG